MQMERNTLDQNWYFLYEVSKIGQFKVACKFVAKSIFAHEHMNGVPPDQAGRN